MKGEDYPQGDQSSAKGADGNPNSNPAHGRRSRLAIKIEPGEKLVWRKVDGEWAKYLVDASAQS
jgi:hypothetical protein